MGTPSRLEKSRRKATGDANNTSRDTEQPSHYDTNTTISATHVLMKFGLLGALSRPEKSRREAMADANTTSRDTVTQVT